MDNKLKPEDITEHTINGLYSWWQSEIDATLPHRANNNYYMQTHHIRSIIEATDECELIKRVFKDYKVSTKYNKIDAFKKYILALIDAQSRPDWGRKIYTTPTDIFKHLTALSINLKRNEDTNIF